MRWLHAARARLGLLFARRAAERRMEEEIGFHIDMEAERLAREEGIEPREAKRRALVAFGGVERHKEALREGRGLAWLGGWSLDLKLGLRMLAKHPGLTIVAVLGMAVAVAIGTVSFGLVSTMADPSVPLDEGERVVAIQNVDMRRSVRNRRTHLHDLVAWREALRAVERFGAYRMIDRNLITGDGRPEPVRIAEMTASGFRIARVPPLRGRYFSDEDEREGAPPVVVIGYSLWQGRFAGDPDIIGRTIHLGTTPHTVIGVMPRGFAFPVNNRVWTPLRLDPSDFERGEAPPIEVFGRLAPGVALADARMQLRTIGERLAATYPATHQHIRPRVIPYTHAFTDTPESAWMLYLIQLGVTLLLVVIGTNVAILVYARTASRTREIAVRTALGASRRRIVTQLFAEALVLSLAASAVGLAVGWLSLRQADAYFDQRRGAEIPFWMDLGISPGMVLYVLAMAVLGALIVGALPALKATRRELHATLQQGSGGTAMRLGTTWTVLIVAQVALAVATLPLAIAGVAVWVRQAMAQPAIPPRQWMTAALYLDREGNAEREAEGGDRAFQVRYAHLQRELLQRVRSEPGVIAAVLTSAVPGEESDAAIEVEGAPAAATPDSTAAAGGTGYDVRVAQVDPELFRAFEIPLLTGRGFEAGDVQQPAPHVPARSAGGAPGGTADASAMLAGAREAPAVIVNRSFVQKVLGGGDALGRRIRRVVRQRDGDAESVRPAPWSEIVGVVPDFPNRVNPRFPEPRIYQPLAAGAVNPVIIAVRVRGGAPAEFGGRLRELSLAVDPMLRLQGVAALDESLHDRQLELRLMVTVVVLVTLSVLLLSAAGIYALMSFTITRRRREIGIRSALGAGPRGIILGVLTRAMRQIAVGIAVGTAIAALLDSTLNGGFTGGRGVYLLAVVAALMAAVGLLAAVGPARRALQIPPTEALKAE